MAMQFAGKWGTWAVDDADLPDYIQRSMDSPGSFRRTFDGTGRRYTQYDKWTWALSWTMVGTTARLYAGSMAGADGATEWGFADGTYNVYVEPGSYADPESGYQVYNISLTLKEA